MGKSSTRLLGKFIFSQKPTGVVKDESFQFFKPNFISPFESRKRGEKVPGRKKEGKEQISEFLKKQSLIRMFILCNFLIEIYRLLSLTLLSSHFLLSYCETK